MESFAARYLISWRRVSSALDAAAVDQAIEVLAQARDRDAVVWSAGNGGGSALASHLAIGLTLNCLRAGGRPFRALSLGGDAATLSAAANDFGAEHALRSILQCNARKGDVLCVFSVSGESANLNNAITAARDLGVVVIAVVGNPDSTTARLSDHSIELGSPEPGIAEDVASAVMHAMYCTFMYEYAELVPGELSHGE